MGILDGYNPYGGGLLGGLGANDLASLIQAYGGYRPPNPLDIPGIEPQFSASGLMPNEPRGEAKDTVNPIARLWAALNERPTSPGFLGEPSAAPPNGAWMRSTAPQSSGAEPSAVWGGPQPAPQSPPNIPQSVAQPPSGLFTGDGSQSSMGGGQGGGVFMPPNATPTGGAIPIQQQQSQPSSQSFRNKLQYIAAILDPSQRPQFTQIGTDLAGNAQHGFVDTVNQTVNGQPIGAGSVGYPKDPLGYPLQGQELLGYLKKTDPAGASMVEAIIRGDASATGRNLQKYLPVATLVDPSLQQFNYDSRKKTALDFTAGGKSANNVKSLETVGGHLEKMAEAYDKLGNSRVPLWNQSKNAIDTALGGGAPGGFETFANGVSNELGTVFRSSGMSDSEVKSWRDRISTSASPEQFNENMRNLLDMLRTRKEALAEQYRGGMGRDVDPKTFQKLDAAIGAIEKRFQMPAASAGWTVKRL